ncbi:hypothetical protein K504DRAFT_487187 [Pleomassaria siparia CBS 279.74]|uniref:Uncharacterized protein n=1 Tax=Pleomassaria siparia CBS 279.74 TaxID=1314801 RepID=A0A6G1KSC4_9PLEO|nr:hypothetical protein K504DRAFT_487187 [Pleomassaria siparia CBS 279.74]
MAGYGNRRANDLNPDSLAEQHNNTRFNPGHSATAYSGGHETFRSGTVGGAGFGNKRAPDPEDLSEQHSNTRFGSHQNTAPYSGHQGRAGSGSTGGAGYGNKTGSFSSSNDSGIGKFMEKAGHVMHNKDLEDKGHTKRVAAGLGQPEQDEEEAIAN